MKRRSFDYISLSKGGDFSSSKFCWNRYDHHHPVNSIHWKYWSNFSSDIGFYSVWQGLFCAAISGLWQEIF
jgi:hypothetical protein